VQCKASRVLKPIRERCQGHEQKPLKDTQRRENVPDDSKCAHPLIDRLCAEYGAVPKSAATATIVVDLPQWCYVDNKNLQKAALDEWERRGT
jgi:hypothetical protein